MSSLKRSAYAALGVVLQAILKLAFSVAATKILAFYAGPSGMAIVGQLQSILQIAASGVASVTTTGVVKNVAEEKHSNAAIFSLSLILLLSFGLVLFFALLALGGYLSRLFLEGDWLLVILIMPLSVIALGVANLNMSYFNGRQEYKKYTVYAMVFSFLIACTTVVLCLVFGAQGAMYSVALSPLLAAFIVTAIFRSGYLFVFDFSVIKNSELLRSLLSYSFMAIVSALFVYGGHIYIRDFIADALSLQAAGVWYSVTRLSELYMSIASVAFSIILLPRYTSLSGALLTREMRVGAVLALTAAALMVLFVIVLSDHLVDFLFGYEFAPAGAMLQMYVIGDAIKIFCWVILYVALAKQRVRFYILFEVFSSVLYVILVLSIFKWRGFDYAPIGYVLQTAISLSVLFIWFFCYARKKV
ncbi:oligosaccharide flippase family protein [Metapseudomonas furukawaii]|uniref:oligosaccharide flippase family protein n=1 Tax=Metapseudomonas furukawaii TaxID=1149133 RepID=UPI00227CB19B|nr:oligosaccharide flippase family protein [Pseudomonas furukawaii]WAG80597.1 oligosaccharide flippase family protein [Pseudomonas furukawaii]